jgi:large subunit ribosomal protein L30
LKSLRNKEEQEMKITLVKSLIGVLPKQKATALSLGLKRPGCSITVEENPAVMGKVAVISHLVKVEK